SLQMTSSMHTLPLYFPQGTKVNPAPVMYSLHSYHEGGDEAVIVDVDPVEQLEKDQLNLIKLLGAFNEKLDKHLNGLTKKGNEKKKEEVKGKKRVNVTQFVGNSSVSKEKGGKAVSAKTVTQATPWKMMEEKEGAETKNGISASAVITLARLLSDKEKIGKMSVTMTANDLFWMENLAKIGSKRDIKFIGDVKNGLTKASAEIEVKKGASFAVRVDSLTLSDRVTGWKIMGVTLGLFSFNHHFAVQNAHTHRWLIRLDEVINGGKKENEVSSLLSSSSQFLSRFDSLSSHSHFSLADSLIRPLFNGNLPNNVELWAKRLDSVV
ncbi:hypothetical protein PENTCL1PPCAC_17926, partial [Pristionchus entomophagus]